ncbi:MAG: hypothetical protein IJJ00_06555 [Erysipelotrichaceae bacterium]|nr:hypothetical protein [Erysipelotrichaceae bacterium]
MANKVKPEELKGSSIYQEKRRTIYSDWFMKNKGYIISENDADKYYVYSLRFIGSLVILFFVIMFTGNQLYGYGAGILFYAVTTLMFYFLFLPKLAVISNFNKPKKDNFINELAKKQNQQTLTVTVILSVLIGTVIIIYAHKNNFDQTAMIAYYIIAVMAYGYGVMNILAFIKKKREYQ